MTDEPPVTPELACKGRDENGGLCPFPPVFGDDKCRKHKGRLNSRQLKRRYNVLEFWQGKGPIKNIDVVRKKNGMPHLGDPIEVDPGVALLQEIHRSAGHVAWLAAKVQSLREEEMVWGEKAVVDEESYGDDGRNYTIKRSEKRAEISKWYDIYEKERRHLASISTAALKAGVEERRVRLAERGVDALETAITLALQDLGIDPHTARARQAIGNRLKQALEGAEDVLGLPEARRSPVPMVVDAEAADYWSDRQDEEEF